MKQSIGANMAGKKSTSNEDDGGPKLDDDKLEKKLRASARTVVRLSLIHI